MADMRYMDKLETICQRAVALIREKTRTYGDSWKRRGGRGAWFTLVRPWDRLEKIVEAHGGDIFAAVAADPSGADGSALACVRDLMNYLLLVEAHCEVVSQDHPVDRVQVYVEGPPLFKLPADMGGHIARAMSEANKKIGEHFSIPASVLRVGEENERTSRAARLRKFGYRVTSWRVPDDDSTDVVRWMYALPGQGYPVGIDSWPHETAQAAWDAAWAHLLSTMDEGTRVVRPSRGVMPPEGAIISYGTPEDGGHHARMEGDDA